MAETPAPAPSQPASAPATAPAATPAPVVQPNATTGTPAAAERGTTAPSVPSSVELQDAYHEMDEMPDDIVEALTAKPRAAETVEEPPQEPQPAAQPAAAPVAATPTATQPAVTPAAQPAATTPATVPGTTPQDPAAIVVQPGAVVETPEQKTAREAAYKEAREKWMGDLRQQFQLSEDDAKGMLLEPEKVLPNLAANLYARVFDSIMATLPHVIPQYVQQHNTMSERETSARGMLFGKWPDLNKAELMPVVAQVGALFRQNNPDATPDVAVDRIGRLAYAALGWDLPAAGNGTKPPAGAPKPASRPFTPAQPGAGGGTPRPKPAPNSFEELVDGPPGSG